MHPILKRILLHGSLTAIMLAIVGFGYAELAELWLMSKAPTRPTLDYSVGVQPTADPLAAELKSRLPVALAAMGFLFIAGGEGLLHLLRRGRPAVPAPPAEPKPEPAEVLLERILAEVERAKATPSDLGNAAVPAA